MTYYYLTCTRNDGSYDRGDTVVVEAPAGLLKSVVVRRYTNLNPACWG
jgi:hypothetical protein